MSSEERELCNFAIFDPRWHSANVRTWRFSQLRRRPKATGRSGDNAEIPPPGYFNPYSFGKVSVNWDFIENTLLKYNSEYGEFEGELRRFSRAADDRLLYAGGGGEDEKYGGAAVFMVNDGMAIGTIKEEIHDNADLFGLGNLLGGGLPTVPNQLAPEASLYGGLGLFEFGGLSSLHINTGMWLTREKSQFYGHNDVYANLGLIQAAFKADRREWTYLKDLEYTINTGVISLLDGGAKDKISIGGYEGEYYYFGGVPLVSYALSEPWALEAPQYDIGFDPSFLKQGYFALAAFLDGEDNEEARADLFKIKGYLGGSTGLIIRNANLEETTGIHEKGIDVVEYHEIGVLDGKGGCGASEYDDALCKDGDTVFISDFTPNYYKVGGTPVVRSGLYDWTLWHDPDKKEFELRNHFGANVIDATSIIGMGINTWYEVLRIVPLFDYAGQFGGAGGSGADLPTDYVVSDSAPASSGGTRTGLWVKGGGSWINTDTTFTQNMVTYDTSYDQSVYSILGGADMKPGGEDSPVRIGLFGGYVSTDLDFNGTPDSSVDAEGGSVGGYAAYNNGAFYLDATVKGEILDTTYDLSGGAGSVDADQWTLGVFANTGYRMSMGAGFIEPILSGAYVHSEVDSFSTGGGTVDFSNGESLRGGVGGRVGTVMAAGGGNAELSVLGMLWNEFEGDNTVTVTSADMLTTETFTDDTGGLFGEAEATASWTNSAGSLSAFVSGGGKWGDNFEAYNVQAGVRTGF